MSEATYEYRGLKKEITAPKGRLGVLLPGMGAVSSTLIAGVFLVNAGRSKPFGSVTQMSRIRLGKRSNPRFPLIREFVPLAEQYGLAVGLDTQVLRMSLDEGLRWIELWGEAAPRLSVNVSPESILDPSFLANLEELLRTTAYPPERLTLEITERIVADVGRTRGPLARLRELGVRIAVDDFGTGYSSLAYLAYLAVDILKVDRAFTRDIGKNPRTEAVLRSIFALGRNLGMQITVEGVEDERQLEWLRRTDCDWVQGFAIARPMQVQAFTRWLDDLLARNRG